MSQPQDIEEIIQKTAARRAAQKGNLTRLHTRVNSSYLSDASLEMITLLEEKALAYFSEYERLNAILEENAEDPTATETCYLECVARLREKMAEVSTLRSPHHATSGSCTKLRLPEVQIPKFAGNYVEYKPFVELFSAFIDKDRNLTDIQKFFYLRSFLVGEPHDLVKNLAVVGSSYKEALNILNDRYDNRIKIVNEHISLLLDMPQLTRTSAASLRTMISNVKQQLAALKNLGEPINKWDSILICILTRKLDNSARNAYYLALNQPQPIPTTLAGLVQFIEGRAVAMESNDTTRSAFATPPTGKVTAVSTQSTKSCIFCGKPHKLYSCPGFMLASVKQRLTFVSNKKLCKICLNSHGSTKCKFHFKCALCKMSHNSLLHDDETYNSECVVSNVANTCTDSQLEKSLLHDSETNHFESIASNVANACTSEPSRNIQVVLPTAKVKLISQSGKEIIVKALLDSASETSFVSNSVAKQIGKQLIPSTTKVIGIANSGRTIRHAIQLDVFSCAYPYKARANFLVVEQITTKLPQRSLDISNIKLPPNIKMADDSWHTSSEIGLLLGSDVFFQALLPQDKHLQLQGHKVDGDAAQPTLVHTQFGYIVAGTVPVPTLENSCSTVALFCQECDTDISNNISKFWQSEKVPEMFPEHNSEQQYVEEYFKTTVKLENDKFKVSLPLKLPLPDVNETLGNSLNLALKRFLNLEAKLQKDQQLNNEYKAFIHEYLELGHASYVDITQYDLTKDPVYFFAHHAVIKHDAVTTKLRTVFDGSMKTSNKVSLNDLMLNGELAAQQELFDILLLFRLHKYLFICDIRRMFRNIVVQEDQRSLLNILWRDSPDEQIKCIQLSTVPYGLKCSSWLATRCLLELVIQYGDQYPLAAPVLLNSTYVDDVLYTDSSLSNIIETKAQLIELLAKGSFKLHKWSANHRAILTKIPEQQQNFGELELNKDVKTLGLKFDIQQDSFKISCPKANDIPETKRQILSYVSQFYDPLGIAGPVFVQAKLLMQKLWDTKVDWDKTPPLNLQKEWQQFYNDLQQMKHITVTRNVCPENSKSVEIIGFSDASLAAMGCAIYLRVVDKQDKVTVSLLCSKSRVASKSNKLTVPRLELNAMLLLAKLSSRVYNTLSKKIKIDQVHLYSDSQVVLAWNRTDPALLNAYVANRIKIINELTSSFKWAYIVSNLNPADYLTKPITPTQLQCDQLWWYGPPFLKETNYKVTEFNYDNVSQNLPEIKGKALVCAASQEKPKTFLDILIGRYSDKNKLTNVLAYLFRFISNCKPGSTKIKENFVKFSEASNALRLLIKNEQDKYMSHEMALLKAGKPASSHLKSLNPFVDAEGIIRVGGRLQHSSLPYSHKHQIVLPRQSIVTKLIIINEHNKLLHSGQKLVLSSLQQRYWIVNGLRLVKKYIYRCMTCFRNKGVTARQLLGSAPADRVNIHRCYKKCGVDFAGPVPIKQSRMRGVITTKGYIAIFVCFVTHACDIQLVSNLETQTFLAALKRFIARRNVPSDIYCDNAGTFKAASTQLSELYKLNISKEHQTQVQNFATKLGINFHFIPSYSPVFAGMAEAAVKSTKTLLKRVLGSHVLTYEELNTVLIQIEGILNSRPITPMSSDPSDFSVLTPGHFITGEPLGCIPEQDLSNFPENKLKFWHKCTAIQQHFWKYWSKNHLNMLQNRAKWKVPQPNVKVGALVLLRETDTPPMTWPMARVTRVFEGDDGLVRALEVKKANGRTHRTSITKICILPIEEA